MIVRYARHADEDVVRRKVLRKVEGAQPAEVLRAKAQVYAVEGRARVAARTAETVAGVRYAEESQRGLELSSPDDTLYERGKQWGLKEIGAAKAWRMSRGDAGPGPDVAVLGTGYFRHPDLEGKVASEHDCGSNDPRADPMGVHGTHVAGVAAAETDNARGVAGVAPAADLFVAQVFTEGGRLRVENLVQCGDMAMKRGVKVISISLSFKEESRLLRQAVRRWNGHGINVVAAAGNYGKPGNRYYGRPIYPAAYDVAIAVAATAESGERWPASSFGPWVDVAAPGDEIVSTSWEGGEPAYEPFSGTSEAAPHVAGALACVRANGKNRIEAQRDLLDRSRDRGPTGKDRFFGHGALDMPGAVRR